MDEKMTTSVRDTSRDISWQEFIEIVKECGFECGFFQRFTGVDFSGNKHKEEEIIFFHKEMGMILYAESLEGKKVEHATVYCEVRNDPKCLTEKQKNAMAKMNNWGPNGKDTMSLSFDALSGLKSCINELSEARVNFCKFWRGYHFIWLQNYMEAKEPGHDNEEDNAEKLAACTPEVRTIVLGGV